jgi:branched-chain amino acid transport system substrate-binding protein
VPLTGPLASLEMGIVNSVDLAVRTANSTHVVPGIVFTTLVLDDGAQPEKGAANAHRLVDDTSVLGVVGPPNSGVGLAMQNRTSPTSASRRRTPPRDPSPPSSPGPN